MERKVTDSLVNPCSDCYHSHNWRPARDDLAAQMEAVKRIVASPEWARACIEADKRRAENAEV
jgi:hypothetical protein